MPNKDNTGVGWTCGYIDQAIATLNKDEATWQERSSAVDSLERVRSMNKELREYAISADAERVSLQEALDALTKQLDAANKHIEELQEEIAVAMDSMIPDNTIFKDIKLLFGDEQAE